MTTKKVIIKRQEDKFQWSQTEDSLTIFLPLKNVLMKNIDVLITKDFIKVNASSIRYICVIDFANPIDHEHPATKVTLMDERLEVNLYKPADAHKIWDHIQVYGLTKEELRLRREQALAANYAREDEKMKQAKDLKLAQDKHSIDQQMKIEGYQRKQIKAKKEEEKKQTESELFRDLDEMEHRNHLLMEQKQEAQKARQETVQKQVEKREQIMNGKAINASQSMIDRDIYKEATEEKPKNVSGDIWDDEEVETLPST